MGRHDSGGALMVWHVEQQHQQTGKEKLWSDQASHHAGTRMSCLSLLKHAGFSGSLHSRTYLLRQWNIP